MIYRLPLPPDARSEAAFLYHNVTAFSTKIDFAQNPWVVFYVGEGFGPIRPWIARAGWGRRGIKPLPAKNHNRTKFSGFQYVGRCAFLNGPRFNRQSGTLFQFYGEMYPVQKEVRFS
jgi:hypothetical protein